MKRLLMILLITIFTTLNSINISALERRKSQFSDELGYIVAPAPYSLPGLGQGVVIFGAAFNLANTYLDLYGYKITGDVEGLGYGFDDLHLVSETLVLGLQREDISKATVMNYEKRGMDTKKEDYNLLEGSNIHGRYGTLSLIFFNRMLELYASFSQFTADLDRISDKDGNVIAKFDKPQKLEEKSTTFGILLDYTDDRQDPRAGVRMDVSHSYTPPNHGSHPEFFVMNYNATAYIPIGNISTWVFNYFRSDAVVMQEGNTDKVKIEEELGLNCDAISDPAQKAECESSKEKLINDRYAANKYGTAASLGGRSRLRSYPDGRFIGAHTQMFGTEIRWNLFEEFTPFDILFMKDIRTGIQLAAFFESGSVAETASDLGKETRESYGMGVRMVMASGIVYRADMAQGDEGSELTVIIDYPW